MTWKNPRWCEIERVLPLPKVIAQICSDYMYDTPEVINDQPKINSKVRVILSDWICEVLQVLCITPEERENVWLCWIVIHRAVLRHMVVATRNYQMLGVACLYYADAQILQRNQRNKTALEFAHILLIMHIHKRNS